uniref:Ubiquitin-like protease family profile domain-containing protein n=1 Tax=Talaromyces marneffei PM1 TaxID=1077442 RepID=A0A093VIS8_TALMA
MDAAISSPRSTIPPSQTRRSLLELSEKLRELADMQIKPETKDVESVPELCHEEPAVAEAIAAAIREKIPEPSPCLSSKRKRRPDPSYRPSHPVQLVPRKKRCTDEENVVDESVTPEVRIKSESPETKNTPDSMIRVDTAVLRPVPNHESKPDPHSTIAMDGEITAKSETIHCSTMPTSPNQERTESPPAPEQDFTESVSFLDTVHQMVDIVHLLNRYQIDLPRTVYQRILQSLHTTQEPIMDSSAHQWSDGRMWMEVLERGSATNRRCSVLNMLEYMGASKWYDSQIEHAKRTVYTTENKPVGEKGAATHVLDHITREYTLLSRKTITNQCSRGKRLRELVEKVGLGILISPKIWEYTKRKGPQFNQLVQDFKADTQRLALFQILTPQVEHLVHKGCTNPEALYRALRENNIISQDELQEMKAKHQSEPGSTSAVTLSKAVDRLTSQVSTQVFSKRKLDENDTVSINGSVELSIDLFARLRAGEWLDSWALMAAMYISDRPDFVRFGESIPLDSIGRHGQMRSIKRPFQAWAGKIAMFRREAEKSTPLIFYCPVNHDNSHFTLLEVNDSEKVIRHYDSQAPLTAMNGTKKTRVAALVEVSLSDEFGDLAYKYTEAPTPQQRDGWSCGTRVVWCFKRLANGLDIGSWDTVLSSERLNMDIFTMWAPFLKGFVLESIDDTIVGLMSILYIRLAQ